MPLEKFLEFAVLVKEYVSNLKLENATFRIESEQAKTKIAELEVNVSDLVSRNQGSDLVLAIDQLKQDLGLVPPSIPVA